MFNIDNYIKFDKTVAIYHGLGSAPNKDRNRTFTKLGYNVISELHDYKDYFYKDLGESFFKQELEKIKNCNLLIGLSYGGYIAYHLSKATGIPAILINPALDRLRSKTEMNKHCLMEYTPVESSIEVFCGELDTSVDPNITKSYLKEIGSDVDVRMIKKMAHRVPHIHFSQIIKSSKLIK